RSTGAAGAPRHDHARSLCADAPLRARRSRLLQLGRPGRRADRTPRHLRMVMRLLAALLALVATTTLAAPPFERSEERSPCSRYHPRRHPFFGALHVPPALSLDASTQDTRNRPADAYRFAQGAPMGIQPYDSAGRALRTVQLGRPLDFTAVTDHAETFG